MPDSGIARFDGDKWQERSKMVSFVKCEEIASKRVPVKPSTWAALSDLRKPGETFDELVGSLISSEQRRRLSHDLDEATAESSVPWSSAAKQLGL